MIQVLVLDEITFVDCSLDNENWGFPDFFSEFKGTIACKAEILMVSKRPPPTFDKNHVTISSKIPDPVRVSHWIRNETNVILPKCKFHLEQVLFLK